MSRVFELIAMMNDEDGIEARILLHEILFCDEKPLTKEDFENGPIPGKGLHPNHKRLDELLDKYKNE